MADSTYRFTTSDTANPDYFVGRVFEDSREIGHVAYSKTPLRSGHLEVHQANVHEAHLGKGLFGQLLVKANQHAISLGHKGLIHKGFLAAESATKQTPIAVDCSGMTEGMEKSFKGLATAAGLALATAGGATAAHAPNVPATQQVRSDFGSKPEDRFLWTVMQVESSGGKNFKHRMLTQGVHKGQRAIGRWGLMPNTVKEILARRRHTGKLSPDDEKLNSMSPDELKAHLEKNPQVELGLARELAQHVLKRQGFDRRKAAYSWYNGHNLKPAEVTSAIARGHPYVKMFDFYNAKNPMKKVVLTQKSESALFASQVRTWVDRRIAQDREHLPRDNSFQPDPGRIAPLSPPPVGKDPKSQIKQRIKEAKQAVKKP